MTMIISQILATVRAPIVHASAIAGAQFIVMWQTVELFNQSVDIVCIKWLLPTHAMP